MPRIWALKSLQGIVNCLRVVGEPISKFNIATEMETGILKEANTYDWITSCNTGSGGNPGEDRAGRATRVGFICRDLFMSLWKLSAQLASLTGQRLALFVPEKALHRRWITTDNSESSPVNLICVNGDYADSISIAEKVQLLPGFTPDGGARNIARRDGMGTVMLDAALAAGRIPDHYFQAVGSGTGGISAWEASMRLIGDGRFGSMPPRLHLVQNIPNAPIYYAWTGKEPSPTMPEMFDDVLFNRRPPYAIPGE